MSQGKATDTLRTIKRGDSITMLGVDALETILEQAEAYHQISVIIMQQKGLQPIERYARIRALIKLTDEGPS